MSRVISSWFWLLVFVHDRGIPHHNSTREIWASARSWADFTWNICTFVCVYIYMCTYCLHIHLHLSICKRWAHRLVPNCYGDGDAASCASRRCYTFALHQSHGIPMPKKVTSNRNLEQWFGSAMITVGHWGIWNARFNQRASLPLKFHFKIPFLQSCFLNDQYSSSFHVIGKQMKIKYLRLAPEELSTCQTEAAHM